MIDRHRRDQLAETLRHFAATLLDNDEYEDRVERTFEDMGPAREEDLALWAVYTRAWYLYDDLSTHKLTGSHALNAARREEIVRWIMFLYTDQEYEWPIYNFVHFWGPLLNDMTFGLWDCITGPRRARQRAAMGDWSIWPFRNAQSYQEARQKPRLLSRH